MKRLARGVFAASLATAGAAAPARALDFETCIPKSGERPAVSVEHGGKTYGLRNEECRREFLSDPERYAQLYEALLELRTQTGTADVSLVPS